ncbi:MAG: hypothetical protein ACE5JG_07625 [Planctomycetota bacterium]
MLLDRGHRRWFRFTVAVLLAGGAAFTWSATQTPGGPRGGSALGLAFGIAGTVCIVFAALLGLRKQVPHWRLGRTTTWMRGHLWLGALALPLILFHGGFRLGGPLTTVLMVLFGIVFVTGLYGLALQNLLPRLMLRHLAQETVYEQVDHVREQLLEEATRLIEGAAGRKAAVPKAKRVGRIQGRVVESRAAAEVAEGGPDRAPLRRLLQEHLAPYFGPRCDTASPLHDAQRRPALFSRLRATLDPALQGVARDLEALCEQRAELEIQRRLHHWLHGWLFLHVPLSYALVVLSAVHAVAALYY